MNLLTYTRFLRRKINFYDKLISKTNTFLKNPFNKNNPSITIIWVEDEMYKE